MPKTDDNPLNVLIFLASTPEEIEVALEKVGGYKTPEEKCAYLEALTGCFITHRSGGTRFDDFLALAAAIISGNLDVRPKKIKASK